jgi:hypothetical protein
MTLTYICDATLTLRPSNFGLDEPTKELFAYGVDFYMLFIDSAVTASGFMLPFCFICVPLRSSEDCLS